MSSRATGAVVLAVLLAVLAGILFFHDPRSGEGSGRQGDPSASGAGSTPADMNLDRATAARASGGGRETPSPRSKIGARTAPQAGDEDPVVARGRVVMPPGLSLDGLSVALHTVAGDEIASGDADETGVYEVRCGASLLGGWMLSTSWVGIAPSATQFTEKAIAPAFQRFDEPHPYGAPPVECDLHIGESPKFEGIVTDAATGSPIEGATVAVFSALPAWREYPLEEATTGEDGKYHLTLDAFPAKQLMLVCKADEFQTQVVGPLDVALGGTEQKSFALASAATITGRVVDEATMQPVSQAWVTIVPMDYPLVIDKIRDTTGEDGRFEIEAGDVALDRAWLRVEAADHAPRVIPARGLPSDVEIKLGRAVVLTGLVRDRDGTPLSSVRVEVSRPEEWAWNDASFIDGAKTGEDGKFRLTLETVPIEEAMVLVDHDPYRPFVAPLSSILTKGSTAAARDVEIVLEREGLRSGAR